MEERIFSITKNTFYREYDAPKDRRGAIARPSRCMAEGEEGCWSFRWADVPPPVIDLHQRLVSIEYSEDGKNWIPLEARGIRVDDDGYDLSVAFTSDITDTKLGVYETRWYNPERNEGRWYRFRIEPRQKEEVFFSKAFK